LHITKITQIRHLLGNVLEASSEASTSRITSSRISACNTIFKKCRMKKENPTPISSQVDI
jgi:hypothetical protein